jgi:hypothetical protein
MVLGLEKVWPVMPYSAQPGSAAGGAMGARPALPQAPSHEITAGTSHVA